MDALTVGLVGVVIALVGVIAKVLDSKVFDLGMSGRLAAYPLIAEWGGLALGLGSLAYEAEKEMGLKGAALAIGITVLLVLAVGFVLVLIGAGLSHSLHHRGGQAPGSLTGGSGSSDARGPLGPQSVDPRADAVDRLDR